MPESFDDNTTDRTDSAVSDPPADAAAQEPATGAEAAAPAEESPLQAVRRERDALQDRLLRLAAEFDNYRKRVDRDRREQADAAMASALEDLLPIIDDLERALEAPTGNDAEGYRKGVELIHRQMTELLRKRGVTPIDAVGADFDPRVHQAVTQELSARHRDGEVIEELRRGYLLGDRLLRPAMVKVARRE